MKNTFKAILASAAFAVIVLAFKPKDEAASIQGTIVPPDGATMVWALSSTDTFKSALAKGRFMISNVKDDSYKIIIDAKEPYKDVIKDNVVVSGSVPVDLGEIRLEK